MALPLQIAAYEDCFEIFDCAIADRLGTRVCFKEYKDAKLFQLRMCNARALQRQESMRLYERGDIRWNKSEYDSLIVRNPREDTEGLWWVYIERHGSNIAGVESLSELEEEQAHETGTSD